MAGSEASRPPIVELRDEAVEALITTELALAAARAAFLMLARGEAANFPVVREPLGEAAVYGVKSGRIPGLAGLKTAGYWRDNPGRGLAAHQATIALVDPSTGRLAACLAGNAITAWRTAAACAVSIDALARDDARSLGMVGAGAQAFAHLDLALAVRPLERIGVFTRSDDTFAALAGRWAGRRPGLERATLEEAAGCDVLITLTPSRTPLVEAAMVAAGAHIAAMGSDTRGKGELAAGLLARARVFGDDRAQAFALGECQRLPDPAAYAGDLGEALAGARPGRRSADEVTVFDGTGMAVQDLTLAAEVLARLR